MGKQKLFVAKKQQAVFVLRISYPNQRIKPKSSFLLAFLSKFWYKYRCKKEKGYKNHGIF